MAIAAILMAGAGTQAQAALGHSVYASFFAGPAMTSASDVQSDGPPLVLYEDVRYKTSTNWGGKVGYWHNAYLGAAFDIFTYGAAAEDQTTNVTTTLIFPAVPFPSAIDQNYVNYKITTYAFTLLARYPLGERFFPYMGIGPAIFKNHLLSSTSSMEVKSTNIGFAAPVGIQLNVMDRQKFSLGLFAEGKITYNPVRMTTGHIESKTNLLTTNVLLGISAGFNL
jgi:opacity protein-like surface antigen